MAEQQQQAKLGLYDGSKYYTFLVNPENIRVSNKATYSSFPVYLSDQPRVKWQYSATTINIPNVRFYVDGNRADLTQYLEQLTGWTKLDPDQGIPRLLKFSYGTIVYPRVYLDNFEYTIRMFLGGNPTMAEGSMSLLIAPEDPEPLQDATATELTDREISQYQEKVSKKLNVDKDKVEISRNGNVTVDGKSKGTLQDVLGASEVRAGLRKAE